MMTHGIVGASSGKGYMSGFEGYREAVAAMLSSRSGTVNEEAAADSGRPASADSGPPASANTESSFLATTGIVAHQMQELLSELGCKDLSPFCRQFGNFGELASVFFRFMDRNYKFIHSRHVSLASCTSDVGPSEEEPAEDVVDGRGVACDYTLAREVDELQMALSSTGESEKGVEVVGVAASVSSEEEACLQGTMSCEPFTLLLRKRGVFEGLEALDLAGECLTQLRAKETGHIDSRQKANSLAGRWFVSQSTVMSPVGRAQLVGERLLKRNDIIYVDNKFYRVLCLFSKSYNKLRAVASAVAKDNASCHAVQVVSMLSTFSENLLVPALERYRNLDCARQRMLHRGRWGKT
eukprot:GHVU01073972.1.p1 GENE.GHVU01073972.1~~GHVU01073972.1.p1  ORF type:complete len:353 (+),score=34.31 GHVU01073972.1:170-1228(+)